MSPNKESVVSRLRSSLNHSHQDRMDKLGLKRRSSGNKKTSSIDSSPSSLFTKVAATDLKVELKAAPFLNYPLHHAGSNPVIKLKITNTGREESQNLTVTVSLQPGAYADVWETNIPRLELGESWEKMVTLPLDGEKLKQVSETITAWIDVKVADKDERLGSARSKIDIHACNEWFALFPETLSVFVQSNDEKLSDIFTAASKRLKVETGHASFAGYQPNDRNYVIMQLLQIHNTLAQDLNFTYINPPPSHEGTGQKIRLVADCIKQRKGTCLDLAVLMSAIWEHAGLHPGIVLIPGHAMLYCWTEPREPNNFLAPVTSFESSYEISQLADLINSGELVVLNSTEITGNQSFKESIVNAQQYIETTFTQGEAIQLIDIVACRREGLTPLCF